MRQPHGPGRQNFHRRALDVASVVAEVEKPVASIKAAVQTAINSLTNKVAAPVAAATTTAAVAAPKPTEAVATIGPATTKATVAPTPAVTTKAAAETSRQLALPIPESSVKPTTTAVVSKPAATTALSSKAAISVAHSSAAASHSTAAKALTTSHSSAAKATTTNRALTSSVIPSISAVAAKSASSSGVSGGTIAGIVIGLIAGIIVIGGLAGFFYKRYRERSYGGAKSSWTKMDDDISPYPTKAATQEKPDEEEFYSGPPAGTAIAPHHNLQNQQQQQYYANGGMPHQDPAMHPGNFAGFGAGAGAAAAGGADRAYGPYPTAAPVAAYSLDGHGRPYSPQQPYSPHQPQMHQDPYGQAYPDQAYPGNNVNPFDDGYSAAAHMQQPSMNPNQSPNGSRQLVGPGQQFGSPVSPTHSQAYDSPLSPTQAYGGAHAQQAAILAPVPVPLGRPQAPNTYDDIAAAEMYSDDRYHEEHIVAPKNMVPYDQSEPYSPRSAVSTDAWAGDAQVMHASIVSNPHTNMNTPPLAAPKPLPDPTLPSLRPMSPFMEAESLTERSLPSLPSDPPSPAPVAVAAAVPVAAPVAAPASRSPPSDSDDETHRMYNEVATAAGLNPENLNNNNNDTNAQPMFVPYQHGQPLPPLREVPTPQSATISLASETAPRAAPPVPRPLPTPPVQATIPEVVQAPAAVPASPPAPAAAGPSSAAAGPSSAAGPSNAAAGPSNAAAGPSNAAAGPSNAAAGPSNAEVGPSSSSPPRGPMRLPPAPVAPVEDDAYGGI